MKEMFFMVSEGDKMFPLSLARISHFTARRALTIINTDDGQYVYCKNIGDVKKKLGDMENFVQVHKSYLLNLDHVVCYSKNCGGCVLLKDGSKIPVARRQKKTFLKTYKSK